MGSLPVAASQAKQAGQENKRSEQLLKHGDDQKSNVPPL
jgi:hypothetical protein